MMRSSRASDQLVYSLGHTDTCVFEKSRTLICEATCDLTIGINDSYNESEILTSPSGIIEISPLA